ncbi:MAG TPA: SOS response-associated peptidase [Caulobacteraceae bacterium]
MCNRYGYQHPYNRLVAEFSHIGPVRWAGAEPNAAREHIRPTDRAPIIRPADPERPAEGLELLELRWGLIPWFHRKSEREWKPLTTNARSESVATTASYKSAFARRRCLAPATHFFEWTANPEGPRARKLMWRFTVPDQEVFAFAGLWDRAQTPEGPLESFTLMTTAPGADCEPYHNRQPVILDRGDWAAWLDLTADVAPLLKAGPAGRISVEAA